MVGHPPPPVVAVDVVDADDDDEKREKGTTTWCADAEEVDEATDTIVDDDTTRRQTLVIDNIIEDVFVEYYGAIPPGILMTQYDEKLYFSAFLRGTDFPHTCVCTSLIVSN